MTLQGLGAVTVLILLLVSSSRPVVPEKKKTAPVRPAVTQVVDVTKHTPADVHLDYFELAERVREKLFPPFEEKVATGPEDTSYYALSQAQIDDLIRFYNDSRVPYPYVRETWDCDDMSREFMHLSRVWNLRRNGPINCVPAAGAAYVKIDGPYEMIEGSPVVKAYHVLIVLLREDGQWFFFEPQSGKILAIEGPALYEGSVDVLKVQI